jgi:uncharacterized protein YndB with AHSA1/START domain
MSKSYSVTRSIQAPVQRVWTLLTDVEEQRRWNTTLVSIDGEIVEGGTIRLVSTVNPKRPFSLGVSDVSAPHRMTWSDGMPLGLFRGVRTFELDERDGATQFTMTETYAGALAWLITRSIPDMTDSFSAHGDALKVAAETPE